MIKDKLKLTEPFELMFTFADLTLAIHLKKKKKKMTVDFHDFIKM